MEKLEGEIQFARRACESEVPKGAALVGVELLWAFGDGARYFPAGERAGVGAKS